MNLLRKLSDLTIAEKQEISNHLWIRGYALKCMEAFIVGTTKHDAWESIAQHEANAIADTLVQQ